MMVEPAPLLPVLPTATQSLESEQEIPVRSTAFAGGLWSDHVDPLFDVLMAYGVELRFVPTAMQVVSLGQTMEFGCVPNGMETRGVQVVRSTVLRDVAPPPSPMPATTHVVGDAHEMDVSDVTEGESNLAHVFPF